MKSSEEMARNVFERRDQYHKRREKREERREAFCRRASAITMAVVCVGMLSITCVLAATINIGDVFRSIFTIRQNESLSESQSAYIDNHAAAIGESVTQDGVTVTIEGAITDGTMAYILVDIVAPDGYFIDSLPLGFNIEFEKLKLAGQENDHISSVSMGCIPLSDNDGKENTASMLIQYNIYQFLGSNFSFGDGKARTLQLQNLFYYEDKFPYSLSTVAEGEWIYEFAFTTVDDKEVELLNHPVAGSYSQISGSKVNATINSILMKGLSATVYYTLAPNEVQEAGDFGTIKVVLKDGNTVNAYPEKAGQISRIENGTLIPNSAGHYCTYVFEAPVSYEDVEAIYIGETEIEINN